MGEQVRERRTRQVNKQMTVKERKKQRKINKFQLTVMFDLKIPHHPPLAINLPSSVILSL